MTMALSGDGGEQNGDAGKDGRWNQREIEMESEKGNEAW